MNLLQFNILKFKPVIYESMLQCGTFLDIRTNHPIQIFEQSNKKHKITFEVQNEIGHKPFSKTHINILENNEYLQLNCNKPQIINFNVIKQNNNSSIVKILKNESFINISQKANLKHLKKIIGKKTSIDIHTLKTEFDNNNVLKNLEFVFEVQKGKIYQYTFPQDFLKNLTASNIIELVSNETIKIKPTKYGKYSFYCDGGIISINVVPGLKIF